MRDAVIAAENGGRSITLVDRDALIRLLLEHYEDLEAEFKAIVPLRKVWVSVE
jgi:restriction system protein